MCHTQIRRHVLCGCIYATILLSQCASQTRLLGISVFRSTFIKHDSSVTESRFEGLPCCERCHELKTSEIEARFETIELKLRQQCEQGLLGKEELAFLMQESRNECEQEFGFLCRPYRRTLRDAMVVGRKGVVDGWNG